MIDLYFPPINKLGNAAFRKLCLSRGADFVFTEMVRLEKLLEGDESQLRKSEIDVSLIDRTFLQVISEDEVNIERGVEEVLRINPKLKEVNYNMGCPQSSLAKKELGAGILRNPCKVYEVSKRLYDVCNRLGVRPSVKLRLGIDRHNINILENIGKICEAGIDKVYIHGRVLDDGYNRPATYDQIREVVETFGDMEVVANGDVCSVASFDEILKTGCNGVLIGRAALENPSIFEDIKSRKSQGSLSGVDIRDRIGIIIEYLGYAAEYGISLSHIKANLAYLSKGVIGGSVFRREINDMDEVDEILNYAGSI